MPKKKSSSNSLKKPSQVQDKPALQQAKQVSKSGKLGEEIDDIFAGRKQKKKKTEVGKLDKKETKVEIAKRKRNELDDGFNDNPKSRPRKRTAEGFLVYTEEELGFNKADAAGYLSLCPFDCNCCF